MGRKRLYDLTYKATGKPIWLQDFGHLVKLSGILVQGMDSNILLLAPTALPVENLVIIQPTLEEWCEIIRQTDDPQVFEENGTGTIKAVHRKQQYAISGAVQQKIWARDGFRCMYCGQSPPNVQITVDHWVPLELGGKNDRLNLISACRKCNKLKGNMPPRDFCDKKGLDFEGLELYLARNAPASFIAHLT